MDNFFKKKKQILHHGIPIPNIKTFKTLNEWAATVTKIDTSIKPIDLNYFVNSRLIYELPQRSQNRKYISFNDVCNTRVSAKQLTKQLQENYHTIDTFQYNEDVALGRLRTLDNVT